MSSILLSINNIIDWLLNFLGSSGALVGCLVILVESILPIIPVSVFFTLNFMTFGTLLGFIMSWFFTILGCMLSYYIFRIGVSEKYFYKLKDSKAVGKIVSRIENMSFASLVTLIAIPFTPAFAINIAAGICRLDAKRYLYALMIGKVSLVYFWGYIGVSLIESLKNPIILVKVVIICLAIYAISKLLSKKLNV